MVKSVSPAAVKDVIQLRVGQRQVDAHVDQSAHGSIAQLLVRQEAQVGGQLLETSAVKRGKQRFDRRLLLRTIRAEAIPFGYLFAQLTPGLWSEILRPGDSGRSIRSRCDQVLCPRGR